MATKYQTPAGGYPLYPFARAAQDYPTRPVTIMVPLAAGTGMDSLVRLYADKRWSLDDRDRRTGYSVVLFLPHGFRYRHPPRSLQQELLAIAGVSSLQISFHEDRSAEGHAMPPGGFRVAIVNCWDRAAGNAARERLKAHFEATRTAA